MGTPIDTCVATNDARLRRDANKDQSTTDASENTDTPDTEEAYPSELLNNLIFRYEEPSTHSRWDKPLFTVPYDDPEPPVSDIFEALTGVVLPTEKPTLPSLTTLAPAVTPVSTADVQSLAGQIRQLLRGGDSQGALQGALQNAPYGADEKGKVCHGASLP